MINYLRARIARLRKDDGQTLIEYALLAFLIAIVSILLLAAIGLDLAETFDEVENALGLGTTNTDHDAGHGRHRRSRRRHLAARRQVGLAPETARASSAARPRHSRARFAR